MPYQVSWLLENRIMLIQHIGLVTTAEMQEVLKESFEMRDRANAALGPTGPLVHTITDATQLDKYNVSTAESQKMAKALRQQRVGWAIFVSPNRIISFLAGVGHQMAGVRYRAFDSMDKAITFLRTHDDTLADFAPIPAQTTQV